MNVWPVIVRELRQQARQPITFGLRLLGVILTATVATLFLGQVANDSFLGSRLFENLHVVIHFAIWVLVPMSAYDCISRERREGTLGLLFLTPLRARDIVIAKAAAHGLRALLLLLSALPVVTISFVLGGVAWQQAAFSGLSHLSAICWALGMTLIASATSRGALRALVLAALFTFGGMLLHALQLGIVTAPILLFGNNPLGYMDDRLLYGLSLAPSSMMRFGAGSTRAPGSASLIVSGAVQDALLSLLFLYVAIAITGWLVRRNWREAPPPLWVQKIQKQFLTPILWQGFYRRWMRWNIQRNPVGWLEQRTWSGRLITWGWLAVIVSVYSFLLSDRNFLSAFNALQLLVAWLLVGSLAASAAGSFRRERESGVLELLLVSPLSAREIVSSRLRGLWGQFLPAMVLFFGVWFYFMSIFPGAQWIEAIFFFGITYATLPVMGLYLSLRCQSFVTAFLLTLGAALFLPMILERLLLLGLGWFVGSPMPSGGILGPRSSVAVVEILLSWLALRALHQRLEHRQFSLERSVS